MLMWEKISGSPCFSVLQAAESWAGPGNKGTIGMRTLRSITVTLQVYLTEVKHLPTFLRYMNPQGSALSSSCLAISSRSTDSSVYSLSTICYAQNTTQWSHLQIWERSMSENTRSLVLLKYSSVKTSSIMAKFPHCWCTYPLENVTTVTNCNTHLF